MSRAPTFTEAKWNLIMGRLSGGELLFEILADEGMPARRTFYDWKDGSDERRQQFHQACLDGEDAIVQRGRRTLRGKGPDQGGESTGDIKRDKEIVRFDLDILARRNKPRWSPLLQHSGEGGKDLLPSTITIELVKPE